MSNVRFAMMIAMSMIVIFALKYFNTFEADHILFSQTRA